MERKLTQAIDERAEVDDAYLGGVHPGKDRCGEHGKVLLVTAVQTTTEETRLWYVRPGPVPGFTKKALVE